MGNERVKKGGGGGGNHRAFRPIVKKKTTGRGGWGKKIEAKKGQSRCS